MFTNYRTHFIFFIMNIFLITCAQADLLQERHEAYENIEKNLKSIKGELKKQTAVNDLAILDPARLLGKSGVFLLTAFDQESYEGETLARKRIWKNKEDFDQRMNAFNQGLQNILKSAEENNQQAFEEAMSNISGHCRGCHIRYREWW